MLPLTQYFHLMEDLCMEDIKHPANTGKFNASNGKDSLGPKPGQLQLH